MQNSVKDVKTKQHLHRFGHVFLLVAFALPVVLVLLISVTGQREESVLENRSLTKLPAFTLSSYADGSFQDDLEKGLIDQLPLMEPVKEAILDGKNDLMKLQQRLLYAVAPGVRQTYEMIADGYYHFAGDDKRIVEKPVDYSARQRYLDALEANFGAISDIPMYVYFIENSRTVDFENPDAEDEVYAQVIAALKPAAADVFHVTDYQNYSENFYQTDHHWNYKGSYKGYQAIYRMLHGSETGMLAPVDTIETDAVFQGSYARQTHVMCADEKFAFQTFDVPKYTTEINGRRRNYGNLSAYEKGKYQTEALANHYANCFGGDFGQIVYDFGTEGKGNLLIVASSYSNPINALIAAGYDKTFVIDLRYYQDWAGVPFDAAAFCSEQKIDAVLLLGDVNFFYGDAAGSQD